MRFISNQCKNTDINYLDLEVVNEFWNRVWLPSSCYKSLTKPSTNTNRDVVWMQLQAALATVPSRRYRRRQAYEYRQDLSIVICIFILFPLSVVLKCQRHFVVKFWLRGSFRVRSWGQNQSSYSARWWTWGVVGRLGSGMGLKPV